MLKSIMAAISRFIAAMPRWTLQRVRLAGEWIMRLVAVPAEPLPPEPSAADNRADEHLEAVRTAAAHIASGHLPPEKALAKLSEDDISWLGAMSKKMHCAVAVASEEDLRAHLRGTKMILGVLNRDKTAVAEYRAAKRRQREREQDVELGLVPAAI